MFFEIFQRFEINWTCCISYIGRKLHMYACLRVYNSEYTCIRVFVHIKMARLDIEIVTIKRGKAYSAEIERSSPKERRLIDFLTTRCNLKVKHRIGRKWWRSLRLIIPLPLYRPTRRFLSISVLRTTVI